jgi:hypothetical protein
MLGTNKDQLQTSSKTLLGKWMCALLFLHVLTLVGGGVAILQD